MLLHALKIKFDLWWLPSTINCFADPLSRTGDTGDIRSSGLLLQEICTQYRFDEPTIKLCPMNESPQASMNMVKDQHCSSWSDGRARFWNPLFDFIQLVVRTVEQHHPCRVLDMSQMTSPALVCAIGSNGRPGSPLRRLRHDPRQWNQRQFRLVYSSRIDRLKN